MQLDDLRAVVADRQRRLREVVGDDEDPMPYSFSVGQGPAQRRRSTREDGEGQERVVFEIFDELVGAEGKEDPVMPPLDTINRELERLDEPTLTRKRAETLFEKWSRSRSSGDQEPAQRRRSTREDRTDGEAQERVVFEVFDELVGTEGEEDPVMPPLDTINRELERVNEPTLTRKRARALFENWLQSR